MSDLAPSRFDQATLAAMLGDTDPAELIAHLHCGRIISAWARVELALLSIPDQLAHWRWNGSERFAIDPPPAEALKQGRPSLDLRAQNARAWMVASDATAEQLHRFDLLFKAAKLVAAERHLVAHSSFGLSPLIGKILFWNFEAEERRSIDVARAQTRFMKDRQRDSSRDVGSGPARLDRMRQTHEKLGRTLLAQAEEARSIGELETARTEMDRIAAELRGLTAEVCHVARRPLDLNPLHR